jgi:Domain of unknown function (DUF5615)
MFLYADEDFTYPVVVARRGSGHSVVTAQEDGRTGIGDADLLARAHAPGRIVLTFNRRHFERLHRQGHAHSGIVSCTRDADFAALAARIDQGVSGRSAGRWCLRINRQP